MKLLFDHSLSPPLIKRLSDLFPDSSHVYLVGLDQADDTAIREKVIWIRRGNCKTFDIESLLRTYYDDIKALSQDQIVGVLALF